MGSGQGVTLVSPARRLQFESAVTYTSAFSPKNEKIASLNSTLSATNQR